MSIFKYKAEDANGRLKNGKIVGLSESDIIARLRKQELQTVSVRDVSATLETKILKLIAPIKNKDLVIFSRQFSVMISASVPVVESLLILSTRPTI